RFGDKVIAPPKGRHWRWVQETIDQHWKANRIRLTRNGVPQFKRYLHEQKGMAAPDVWDDIKRINQVADERCGFDTQKPLALLERILLTSSEPDEFVADFFCGSGTTMA